MGLFFRDVHYLSCTYPSPCICDAALMIHFKFRTLLLISLIGILNVTDFLNHLLCLSWAPLWPITAHLTSYRNMNSIHEQCEKSYESFLLNFWKWQNRAITPWNSSSNLFFLRNMAPHENYSNSPHLSFAQTSQKLLHPFDKPYSTFTLSLLIKSLLSFISSLN